MSVSRKAWVTFVVDEDTCLQALVLMKSLRRTITTADVVALVCKNQLPLRFMSLLHDAFDAVIYFERNFEQLNTISTLDEGKLFSWTLTMFKTCVILNPSLLILKNCDELFQLSKLSGFDGSAWDDTMMIVKPSYGTYSNIVETINTLHADKKEFAVKLFLEDIFARAAENGSFSDLEENVKQISGDPSYADKMWNSAFEKPWELVNGNRDGLTCLARFWLSTFDEEVAPCLGEQKISLQLERKLVSTDNCTKAGMSKSYHNELKQSIAIVGQSCRLPGANNVEEFWDLLERGGDAITSIPLDRLPEHRIHDPKYTSIKAGFLKCPIDEFDAKFFEISPREAEFMDPQQRLLVEVAWEALEDAAINPQKLRGSNTGVFSGIWKHEYEPLVKQNTKEKDFNHVVLGNSFSATSARVSYFLGLNGPNVATESGCSSSMVALHLACDSLRKRETDLALATGVNLLNEHFQHSEVSILAKDGHCKTFDEKADGFARAEGAVVMVLKRFSDAVKDGDRIYSIVRGSALSDEGTTSSFGTPSKYCQEIAIRDALKVAGVKPEDVDYVEAHGTGTPVGDPIEFAAISAGYKAQRDKPLLIGSVKTNTGHTESAAGLAGLLKINLAMEKEIIPPHRNLDVINPNINLESLPAVIPTEKMDWVRSNKRRRLAGVSSFGISGTNVHVILEEPPEIPQINLKSVDVDRTHHLLTLSVKTENALKDVIENYCTHLDKNPDLLCEDICYTANTGRQHLKHRTSVVAKDSLDLKQKLSNVVINSKTPIENPKTVFLFTGQGSQYPGMARALYEMSPIFKRAFNSCNEILINNAEISLEKVLWSKENDGQGNLDDTIYSQTAIFCIEYGLLKLWESFGIKLDYVLGHSVGEFAASVAAGILSLEDALRLVAVRSRLIQNLPSGGMLALRSDLNNIIETINSFLSENSNDWLDIAVINSPRDLVVAGKDSTLEKFSKYCEDKNMKTQPLAAKQAFHSRDMEGMVNEFGKVANEVKYRNPTCKYVSGSTGEIMSLANMNGKYWEKHVRNTVDFTKGIKTVHEEGCNVFIEIGAQPILLAIALSNLTATETQNFLMLPSIRKNEENWLTLFSSVSKLYESGVKVDWERMDSAYTRKKISLPHYPFQRQKYWIQSKSDPITKALHPLLGRQISLSCVKETVFENILDLNDLPYLRDHKVANVVILPAAGFLELILAAGRELFCKDVSKKILVEDFAVDTPMELEEGKEHKVQTVVSEIEDGGTLLVQVFVYRSLNGYNEEKGWKKYASGNVSTKQPNNNECTLLIPHEEIQSAKSRCLDEVDSSEFYKKTNEIGINFGETFQSISKFWTGKNEGIAEIQFPVKENLTEYIYHPIVLDAMIQCAGYFSNQSDSNFRLPIGVQNISMISHSDSSSYFVHVVTPEDNSGVTVSLFDDKLNLLSTMTGIKLVESSIDSFMNVISASKNKLPEMYEMIWRQRESHFNSRINLSELPSCSVQDVNVAMREFVKVNDQIITAAGFSDKFCRYSILLAFSKLGWKPQIGDEFCTQTFMTQLLLSPKHLNFVERLLSILVEDGYLNKNAEDSNGWVLVRSIPSDNELLQKLEGTLTALETTNFNNCSLNYNIVQHCCKNLPDVLLGKVTGTNILFDNKDPDLNPLLIYTEGTSMKLANLRIKNYLMSKLNGNKTKECVVRILEVGAGSAATSCAILEGLEKLGITYRYTFTDISSYFFENAKEKLKGYSGVHFKILNIENDPKYQGFVPHSYDIVVAANVIHATEYLSHSIQNVRQLLVPQGLFILQEMLTPLRNIDLVYGMVEGYWCFKDFDIRWGHPCVDENIWNRVLTENGFHSVTNISSDKELVSDLVATATDVNPTYSITASPTIEKVKTPTWVIFSGNGNILSSPIRDEIQNCGDDAIILNHRTMSTESQINSTHLIDYADKQDIFHFFSEMIEKVDLKGVVYLLPLENDDNQEMLCGTLLNVLQCFVKQQLGKSKILCVTRGAYYWGDQGSGYPSQATVSGVTKCMKNEYPDFNCRSVDLDPDNKDTATECAQIFSELWNSDSEYIVAYRNMKRHVIRLTSFQTVSAPLVLPNGRYEIVIPKSKKINDVSFRAMNHHSKLRPNDVEISVKATALNFRDIFVILKPDMYSTNFQAVGTDFAGEITQVGSHVKNLKIGDNVFGISYVSAVASHVTVSSSLILPKPKEFTFAEASTFPSVFLTAYFSLVNVANLKTGETILIHVASGGVGLVAIQIAHLIGAKIIATAGNKRKRNYLRSLGVEHVFHSRDLTFGEEIEKVTNGNGVDVVLNSLTGPGFKETSLKVCSKNARFVELGKVNIWQPGDVARLRPDVNYTIVNLEKVGEDEMNGLMMAMKNLISEKKIRPLPYTKFFISQIKDALNYFLKSQHIGKVVVTTPELKETNGRYLANNLLFNENGTYLVTGGLGGIGLEVAKWMVNCGAKNVVLVGRTAPNEKTEKILKGLSARGCRVLSRQVDIGNWTECVNLFDHIKLNLPLLRGVIHSAGALADGIIPNQTWEKFQTVFNAKVQGGWNLHQLTKDLSLEHFVLFSSMAGILGSMAQSNHAAGNMFLDSLASYRHSLGLAAQTINWGAWSEVGVATNSDIGNTGAFGVRPFSVAQGISALQFCMSRPVLQVGVAHVDLNIFIESYPAMSTAVSELLDLERAGNTVISTQTDQFWKEIETLTKEERIPHIKKYVDAIIRQTLKLPDCETLDEHQSFSEMGLDSLMAVEMRNKLQQLFGKRVTLNPTSLLDYPTLTGLSKYLAELSISIVDGDIPIVKDDAKTTDKTRELFLQDLILPKHISKLNEPVPPSKIRNILLTGVTGHLGVYLLKEFVENSNFRVVCLIRAKNLNLAQKKLVQNLKKFNLYNHTSLTNVSVVLGDITEDFFGLSKDNYENLAEKIDAIFHCAVKASHIEKYQESRSKKDIRSVNVLGTLEVLKFACANKTKRVFYASSITAANTLGSDGFISEEMPGEDNNGEGICHGYAMTKFVGEKLMSQALKRGIPCTTLRFTSFIGHSKTGQFTTNSNLVSHILRTSLQLQIFREIPGGWYFMPVDIAAKIAATIFFNDNAELGLYNIASNDPMTSGDFVKIAEEIGTHVEIVDKNEFSRKLLTDGNELMNIFREAYNDLDIFETVFDAFPVLKIALSENKKVLRVSDKLRSAVKGVDEIIPPLSITLRQQLKLSKDLMEEGIMES